MNTVLKGVMTRSGLAWCVAAGMAGSAMPIAAQTTSVTVDNARLVPVVVYLERGRFDSRFDTRLGTVPPQQTGVLSLPQELKEGQAIRLLVHPEGGKDMATPPGLVVKKGQTIKVSVAMNDEGFVPPPAEETPDVTMPRTKEGVALIEAKNESNNEIVIFLERGQFGVRLATVPAHQNRVIELPPSLTRGEAVVHVFVHEEGAEDLESQPFKLASPGARLRLRVPN